MDTIKLIVSDDHPLVVNGLLNLFHLEKGFKVLAYCTNGEETLKAVVALHPDVLVLDLRLPGMSGLEVMAEMSKKKLATRVVVLTAALDESQMAQAIRLGVGGVVLKDSAPQTLVECIRRVHAGEQWFEKGALGRTIEQILGMDARRGEVNRLLSPREVEVVRKVYSGLPNKEIGKQLFISEGTVKVHLHNIYEKLGIRGRLKLVRYAESKGLV